MAERPHNSGIAYAPVANHAPHDTTETVAHNAIMVDADGDVVVTNEEDVSVTMYCLSGIIYPVHCKLIKATGTTAADVTLFA